MSEMEMDGAGGLTLEKELAFNGLSSTEKAAIVMFLLEENGAKVLIDEVSVPYLEGSVIDYKNDLIGQSFEIQNPNATSSCGCGTSFSM